MERYIVIEGYVACSYHGEIHEDTLDPYEYGEPAEGEEDLRCSPKDHVPVYEKVTK